MPKGTVSQETFRHELTSLPGGFVELRQLSYHEMMRRRDIASKLFTEQQVSRNRKEKRTEEMLRAQLEIMNVATMEFEFGNCIVNHNIEDDNGVLLDFKSPMSFRMLDPKIGAEINRYIDDLNQEDEDDLVPLENAATSSLQDGLIEPAMITDQD